MIPDPDEAFFNQIQTQTLETQALAIESMKRQAGRDEVQERIADALEDIACLMADMADRGSYDNPVHTAKGDKS